MILGGDRFINDVNRISFFLTPCNYIHTYTGQDFTFAAFYRHYEPLVPGWDLSMAQQGWSRLGLTPPPIGPIQYGEIGLPSPDSARMRYATPRPTQAAPFAETHSAPVPTRSARLADPHF